MAVKAIFVVDQNANYVDENGSSKGISNPADLLHLKRMRALADCVVTSGKTARQENYQALSNGNLVIVSRRAPHEFSQLVGIPGVDFHDSSPVIVVEQLRERFKNVLLEFGPESLNECVRENLVDELQLSVTGPVESYSERVLDRLPIAVHGLSRVAIEIEQDLVVLTLGRMV